MTARSKKSRLGSLGKVAGLCLLVAAFGQDGADCINFIIPGLGAPTTPAPGNDGVTGQYVGTDRCGDCHKSFHTNWSDTLHAKALESLEEIGQDTNPECLACHTVGFGQPGGFVDRATTNVLANVGCEACHGPSRDHVENIENKDLLPPKNISASVCGQCHTGAHHPNFDEWQTAGHSGIAEYLNERFSEGRSLNSCGQCHSGDFFYMAILEGETVADDALVNVPPEERNGITCAVCHDPHQRTGNAVEPGEGRDFQLRFPEVALPTPTNTVDAATNPARFNLCGQCHHSRGRDWTATSRGPHHSVQSNVFTGEMPMPDADAPVTPIVPSIVHRHYEAREQCATCHMFRQDFMSDEAPAIAGHSFQVSFNGCLAGVGGEGCHEAAGNIMIRKDAFQAAIMGRLDAITSRLGDPATWEYSSTGGPPDQTTVSDNIKMVRFLLRYIEGDGSKGIHNPDYVQSMLDKAEDLLTLEGK